MRRIGLLIAILIINFKVQAIEVKLDSSILNTSKMPFVTHVGEGFQNALALNVEYEQIKTIRPLIEKEIGEKLKFLKSWDPEGEAHVTTITPPEFVFTLSKVGVTMEEINKIAREHNIQNTDLQILGLGSGEKEVSGKKEQTFFLIVDSQKLRNIRHAIWKLFVQKGGNPQAFDPTWWFPHITIGYTWKDIHEDSGLIKKSKTQL